MEIIVRIHLIAKLLIGLVKLLNIIIFFMILVLWNKFTSSNIVNFFILLGRTCFEKRRLTKVISLRPAENLIKCVHSRSMVGNSLLSRHCSYTWLLLLIRIFFNRRWCLVINIEISGIVIKFNFGEVSVRVSEEL